MTDWKRLKVPPFCERLIGFSIPDNGKALIVSYEALHVLFLGEKVKVITLDNFIDDIYDEDTRTADWDGQRREIIGLYVGSSWVVRMTSIL